MAEVGDRVYAVRNAGDDAIYLFGHGRFLGNHTPPILNGPWSEDDLAMARRWFPGESNEALEARLREASTNPKIELDSGEVVWGYECWWAPADSWDEFVEGREVVPVSLADYRAKMGGE